MNTKEYNQFIINNTCVLSKLTEYMWLAGECKVNYSVKLQYEIHQIQTPGFLTLLLHIQQHNLAPITGRVGNVHFKMWEENPKWGKPMQSGRDWKPNPHARLWSEVGFKPGSTELKGRDRNHSASLILFIPPGFDEFPCDSWVIKSYRNNSAL